MISVSYLGWANLETGTLEQMINSHRRHSSATIKIVSGGLLFTLLLAWLIPFKFFPLNWRTCPARGWLVLCCWNCAGSCESLPRHIKPWLRCILQFFRNLYQHFRILECIYSLPDTVPWNIQAEVTYSPLSIIGSVPFFGAILE